MTQKSEVEIAEPTEGKRIRTTLNLLRTQIEELSEIADAKNLTKTAIIDEALSIALSKLNDTTQIDQAIASSNSFWFNRDLERVKQILPPEEAKKLSPHHKVHLYSKLKDAIDQQHVFEALGLITDLDEINTINAMLEKASKFQDGRLLGYNLNMLAHNIRAKLTLLQEIYLAFKLGMEAMNKLRQLATDKFPKLQIFTEQTQPRQNPSQENVTLETILAVIGENAEVWRALPESVKKQVHDAVAKGQVDLAKGLVVGAKATMEIEDIEVASE
jgi:hypothetical protein